MRGTLAASLAGSAVVLVALAVLQAVVSALDGAYLMLAVPVAGLFVALGVFGALRRVCRGGSRSALALAYAGVVVLVVGGFFGVSFGGVQLIVPAALLAVAATITPRPRAPRRISPASAG